MNDTAKMPTKAHKSDAGFDLYVSRTSEKNGCLVCHSDVAFEIPEGYVGLVFPRSSIANTGLMLTNSVGVIDSCYRGDVMCKFRKTGLYAHNYEHGDRFAQIVIMPYPEIEFVEADELSESDRGTGGYGSSGK